MTIIIDGNNAANRSYFGYPALFDRWGREVQIVYGVLDTINKAIRYSIQYLNIQDNINVIVAWDRGIPEFRLSKYPNYKNKKPSNNSEIAEKNKQINEDRKQNITIGSDILNNELLPMLNILSIWYKGAEADDIISVLVKLIDDIIIIVSTDTDFYQLIEKDRVYMFNQSRGKEVFTSYYDLQVSPEQTIDVKVLAGDSSDNLPGIKGIGEKTAIDLIKWFGGIKQIIAYSKFKQEGDKYYKYVNDIVNNISYIINASIVINLDYSIHIPGIWEDVFYRLHNFKPKPLDIDYIQNRIFNMGLARILEGFKLWIEPLVKISNREIPIRR